MHHRPGNVHDLNGAADFMLRCFENAKSQLSGTLLESRIDGAFMARATALFGHGGQMRAERELGWDRGIIEKGQKSFDQEFHVSITFQAEAVTQSKNIYPTYSKTFEA